MEKRLKNKKVNFWVEPERYERFVNACKSDKREASDVFRILMDEYSDNIERMVKEKDKNKS